MLYGDGTPADLRSDYLDYLRAAIAMAVEVLLAEDQLVAAARKRAGQKARADELEVRLEGLVHKVRGAIADLARSPDDNPVTRCANHIEGVVDEVVARAVADVRAHEETAAAGIAALARRAHGACFDAVEGFVRAHRLPEATRELELDDGVVVLHGKTPYHVAFEIELAPAEAKVAVVRAHFVDDAVEVELRGGRRAAAQWVRLRSLTLDGVPLEEHDRPSLLVDRLFATMAPEVRTIVERSRVRGELSLRRVLGGDRREEIFVAHTTLAEMIAQLPAGRRRHFDSLGLPGVGGSDAPPEGDGAEASDPSISIDYEL